MARALASVSISAALIRKRRRPSRPGPSARGGRAWPRSRPTGRTPSWRDRSRSDECWDVRPGKSRAIQILAAPVSHNFILTAERLAQIVHDRLLRAEERIVVRARGELFADSRSPAAPARDAAAPRRPRRSRPASPRCHPGRRPRACRRRRPRRRSGGRARSACRGRGFQRSGAYSTRS